ITWIECWNGSSNRPGAIRTRNVSAWPRSFVLPARYCFRGRTLMDRDGKPAGPRSQQSLRRIRMLFSHPLTEGFSTPLLRYLGILSVPTVLIFIGTAGYKIIEGDRTNFLDALYMTIITLTTVGYGEFPEHLSPAGRIFTMFLLLGGVFTLFWAAG